MWRKVVHLEVDQNTIPTTDRTALKTFAQASDRFHLRKNTQGRHLVSRPRASKSPFSQTESHFYKNASSVDQRQKVANQSDFRRTSKSVDSRSIMGRLALSSHGFSFHSERYGPKKLETAKKIIYNKIQAHNQNLFSKMYSLGKEEICLRNNSLEFQVSYTPQPYVKPEEKTTYSMKQSKVTRGASEWKKYKKWENRHQGLKKFMNQPKKNSRNLKTPQKDVNPWQTSLQIDEVDY